MKIGILKQSIHPKETLLSAVFLLLALSAVMVFSASAFHYLIVEDSTFFLKRQMMWIGISAAICYFTYMSDYRILQKHYRLGLALTAVALVLVLIPGLGIRVNQSSRRLPLGGGLRIQPSEIAKITVLVFIAGYICNDSRRTTNFFKGFMPAALSVGAIWGSTLAEPDLGTSTFILGLGLILMLIGGMRWRSFLAPAAGFTPFLVLFAYLRREMIVHRFQGLFNPEGLHQLRHSLRALGSGGVSGMGLGAGMQKLRYLPEAHTDFVFAVIGEELGLVGTLGVISLFLVVLWSGVTIARRAKDSFGYLLAAGIILSLGMQAAFNIAVVTGSAPTKGIPLPLVTFGGTGLCVPMAQIGLLLSIYRISQTPGPAYFSGVNQAELAGADITQRTDGGKDVQL
ncbi:MAG: putative lipid II flippase FtsW [Planctomycetes bacterium]|nr:putative lipid II flippase FtsW [Planctomycetota bacterium]